MDHKYRRRCSSQFERHISDRCNKHNHSANNRLVMTYMPCSGSSNHQRINHSIHCNYHQRNFQEDSRIIRHSLQPQFQHLLRHQKNGQRKKKKQEEREARATDNKFVHSLSIAFGIIFSNLRIECSLEVL